MNRIYLQIFLLTTSLFFIFDCSPDQAPVKKNPSQENIDLAINKAIDFLYKNQLPYGEFRTFACSDKTMGRNCYFDSSPFVTTFVIYSIGFVKNDKVVEITDKAIRFFLNEMDGSGIWRYWTSKNSKKIDPDLDDISCISFIIKKYSIPFKSNKSILFSNMSKTGEFYTWIRNSKGIHNDIDCVVNANVLLYLGCNGKTERTCEYVNNCVIQNRRCSRYYPDRVSFYYMISRAYNNGVSCLERSRGTIIKMIKSKQGVNGSFGNELCTALAVCTFINFNYSFPDIKRAVHYLISKQREDGSWQRFPFYLGPAPYYGSEELTTAIAVEALTRFLQHNESKG